MAGKDTIAVLGAGGTMGSAMARNLLKAGFSVTAWNRSREKAEPLGEHGARLADGPEEATDGAEIVLTMLADADAVLSAAEAAVSEGVLWLQMSTIGEEGTERCLQLARERGVTFVDAPVLGTKQPAQEGQLVVLASGPEDVRDRLSPIFDAVGQRTIWAGEAGAGSRLKVATNAWLLAVIEGGAETFALAEGMGLDPQLVLDAVEGGPLDLPYLRMKGQAMMERAFEPSFRLALAAKDAGLAEASAARHHLDLPLIQTIRERLEQAVDEHGDKDMSATFLTSAPS